MVSLLLQVFIHSFMFEVLTSVSETSITLLRRMPSYTKELFGRFGILGPPDNKPEPENVAESKTHRDRGKTFFATFW